MARRQHARLVCLFVASHYLGLARVAVASAGADVPLDFDKDELAKEIFGDLRVQTNRHGIDAEFVIRAGDPASEIQQVVDELKPDMVVVGASMKADHRLVGSAAIRLVKSAKCPVTVVP
jgi:nucleotide-binding universal stress UspA family protein